MSSQFVSPELVAAAAADLTGIGSTISSANGMAAAATTKVLAPAADGVSTAIAAFFSEHGEAYQALSVQAASFHDQIVQALTAGAESYGTAEAVNTSPLQELLGRRFTGNIANGAAAEEALNPPGNSGPVQVGAGTVGLGNLGAENFSLFSAGVGNTGTGNVGIGLIGVDQIGFGGFNSGVGNAGFGNSGTANIGFNYGSNNSGAANSGSGNIGFTNAGSYNTGLANAGTCNASCFNPGIGNVGWHNMDLGNPRSSTPG